MCGCHECYIQCTNCHDNSTPLREKRTEVTQVRLHDAPCGFPFFIPRTAASVLAWQSGVQKALLPTIFESWKTPPLPSILQSTDQLTQ